MHCNFTLTIRLAELFKDNLNGKDVFLKNSGLNPIIEDSLSLWLDDQMWR